MTTRFDCALRRHRLVGYAVWDGSVLRTNPLDDGADYHEMTMTPAQADALALALSPRVRAVVEAAQTLMAGRVFTLEAPRIDTLVETVHVAPLRAALNALAGGETT